MTPSRHASNIPALRTPSVSSLEDISNARTPSNYGIVRSEPPVPGFEHPEIQPRLVGLSQPSFTPTVPSSPAPVPGNLPSNQSSPDKGNGSKRIRVLVAEESNIKDCMDCGMDMSLRSVVIRNMIDLPPSLRKVNLAYGRKRIHCGSITRM